MVPPNPFKRDGVAVIAKAPDPMLEMKTVAFGDTKPVEPAAGIVHDPAAALLYEIRLFTSVERTV